MLGALFTAYVRTRAMKIDDQTSHTIAIVSMLSYYMLMVKGPLNSSSDAVEVILQLHKTLRDHSRISELFSSLQFSRNMAWTTNQKHQSEPSIPPDITDWPSIAPALGMNIVFRPIKSIDITSSRHDKRPWQLLIYSALFAIAGSYLPAFFLSYFTFATIGFGCRCFAWTIIASF